MTPLRSMSLFWVSTLVVSAQNDVRLIEWTRGIAIERPEQKRMAMYLWFYEWNMFEAMKPGAHTRGRHDFSKRISLDGKVAAIDSDALTLRAKAVADGAELELTAKNLTQHAWPEIAGIIPCFSPGQPEGKPTAAEHAFNPEFTDVDRNRTWFLSPKGLAQLDSRAIHFNRTLRDRVAIEASKGKLPFDDKWPTSDVDASAGILIRESANGKWVAGIAWEDYLSVQGHNPWFCMHLAVRVGPLKSGESKTIRGRMFLFPGDREECLRRMQSAFNKAAAGTSR